MLHGRGIQITADSREQRFSRPPIIAEHADLDELMGEEIQVNLVQNRWRKAVLSNRHHRMKRMRLCTKGAPRGGC